MTEPAESTAEPQAAEPGTTEPETADPETAESETSEPESATQPAPKRRFRRLRRYTHSLDHVGLMVATAFFAISLTPSLLPRTWPVQGLLSGLSAIIGYAIGTTAAALCRLVIRWRPGPELRKRTRWVVWGISAVVVVVMLWLGSSWQNDIRKAVDYPPDSRFLYTGVFVVAALVAALLLGIGRLLHDLGRWLARLIGRWLPRWASVSIAFVVTAALAWGILAGVVGNGLVALAEKVFSTADQGTHEGDKAPTSALRSGSPASKVKWDQLGLEGRAWIANGPSAADITKITGKPALEPIRVYAGRESASSIQGEADLVLDELKRTKGFDRQVLAVATSTGTGWLDPWQTGSLEYLFGGNTAIASMQYSFFPSWISFLIDRPKAVEAGRDLFDTIYDYWKTLPAGHRPKLVVYGESLGAFGGNSAFKNIDDVLDRTDAALFTGPPNSTKIWRTLTDDRKAGSPERQPVSGDGTTVRFASNAEALRQPDGTLPRAHVVYLQHASDPIVWWSPDLIFSEPDWLDEPKGPDVISQVHYFPLITFWQITCDMIASTAPPAGHGHTYGKETIDGWITVLHPAGWTDAMSQSLIKTGMPTSSP